MEDVGFFMHHFTWNKQTQFPIMVHVTEAKRILISKSHTIGPKPNTQKEVVVHDLWIPH